MIQLKETASSLSFKVLAVPNSSITSIVGEHDHSLKIKLAAPPVDGKANQLCLKYLAKQLKIAKTSLDITSGHSSKRKQIIIRFASDQQGKKELVRVKAKLLSYSS